MDTASGVPTLFRFAGFEFHASTGELQRQSRVILLPEQACRVLLALLAADGEVVSREELRTTLWPGRSYGDFDGGLNTAICKLRQVLDDDGAEPRIIGTLPRRGYRLLVPVEVIADAAREEPAVPSSGRSPWRAAWLVLALGVAGTVVVTKPWETRPGKAHVLNLPGGVKLALVELPAGEFAMGFDTGFRATEPVHRVTLTHGFWMGRTEVTQAQWRAVMGNNPSYFQGEDKPVEQVSWEDCQAFAKRLGTLFPSLSFRLPTEAEWEYAARAGNLKSRWEQAGGQVWDALNSQGQTHPVGQKKPNPWGLYDMLGNVWEWTSDGFGPYLPYPQVDPQRPVDQLIAIRGGSWLSPGGVKGPQIKTLGATRVTLRVGVAPDWLANDLGFRIVAIPQAP